MAFVIKDGSEEPLVFQSEEELKNWANNNGFWYKNGTVIVPLPDNGPVRRYKVSEERVPTFSVVDNNTYQGGLLKGITVTKSKPKKTGGLKAREDVWGKGNPVWGSDRVRGVARLERRNPEYADAMRAATAVAGAAVDPRLAALAGATGLTYVATQYGPAVVDGLRSGVEYVGKLANDAYGTILESRKKKNKGNNKGTNKPKTKQNPDPAEGGIDDAADIEAVANTTAGAAGTAAAGATPPTNPNDEDNDTRDEEQGSNTRRPELQQNLENELLREQLRLQLEAHQREILLIREEMQQLLLRTGTSESVSNPPTPAAEPTTTTPTKGPWLFRKFRQFGQTPTGKMAGRMGLIAIAELVGATGLDAVDHIFGAIGERSGRKSNANWNATKYWSPAGWLYQWSTSEATPGDSLKSEGAKHTAAETDSVVGTVKEIEGKKPTDTLTGGSEVTKTFRKYTDSSGKSK